jgi:hypothetical protein
VPGRASNPIQKAEAAQFSALSVSILAFAPLAPRRLSKIVHKRELDFFY